MRLSGICTTALFALACGTSRPAPTLQRTTQAVALRLPQLLPARGAAPPALPTEVCDVRVAKARAGSPLPGTPRLDKVRGEMLARAKGEPVVFVRPPEWPATPRKEIQGYRNALARSRFPWDTVDQFVEHLRHDPQVARQVLLRDGYLYAESADLAWSLWKSVELRHLFDEPELVIERGRDTLRVTRRGRDYFYADGAGAGKPARLWLFDRVRVGDAEVTEPLHRDLRSVQHELHFDRIQIEHITSSHIVATASYEGIPVTTLLSSSGAKVKFECEVIPDARRAELELARERAKVRADALAVVRSVIRDQVLEELPFDEPKNEWGQQDGHLKSRWKTAYLAGEDRYLFNFQSYPVFSADGKPAPPQVCIDFITETLERSAGTWWRNRGDRREKRVGRLSLDELISGDRRQVPSFVAFARAHPDWFEVYSVPSHLRLPYLFKKRFYRFIQAHRDKLQPADVVVIRGPAPWDHYNVPHYHTFFVYERDPVTAVPILLAGNAGKPRIQSWESVMSRTPQRKIETIIRPRMSWLASVVRHDRSTLDSAPPPLAFD
ncbi:MAG: hypothetical protein R3B13_32000 [Polyangiaceae bacterium]